MPTQKKGGKMGGSPVIIENLTSLRRKKTDTEGGAGSSGAWLSRRPAMTKNRRGEEITGATKNGRLGLERAQRGTAAPGAKGADGKEHGNITRKLEGGREGTLSHD